VSSGKILLIDGRLEILFLMIETNEFTKQGLFSIQTYKTRLILKKIRENNSQD